MNRASSFIKQIVIAVCLGLIAVGAELPAARAADKPPLKALFVTGGGYHDYQKLVPYLTTNLSERIYVKFDVVFGMNALKDGKFAKAYDVVVYDVCFDDAEAIEVQTAMRVAKAGKPTVMIHCAVHAFRNSPSVHEWEDLCGMRSKVHDPYQAFATEKLDTSSPITKAFPADWKTPGDELYQTIELMAGSQALLRAKSPKDGREHTVCWTHEYGKGRVFATTLGHDFKTVESADYLGLLANGILWACDKLKADGTPKNGFEAPKHSH